MSKQIVPPEHFQEMSFPKNGIDRSVPYSRPRTGQQNAQGVWTTRTTTPTGINVRTFEPTTLRSRGGQRPGLERYIDARPGNVEFITQLLAVMVNDGIAATGGGVQSSQSGRVVTLVCVSEGNVYVANAGDTDWTAPTNSTGNTPPLNFTGIVSSAPNISKLWFADGINWVYYNPSDNQVHTWAASAGSLPVDSDSNTPRLICTWRGRTVLSGLLEDPQNWFMSKVGDPTNFDYSPTSTTPTQAIAGNNAPQGLIGDVVTAMIAYTDDVLIFGGDHSIYMMRGDPMAGGQIDLVSNSIGMAWGDAWCQDPYGTLYFYSNRSGIYSLVPGQVPQRISQQIEHLLQGIDTGENAIKLLWNDRFQGFHVFITLLDSPAETTHFFYELRTSAWWQDVYANTDHNPLACCIFDGNLPGDRVALIGSWDGYVRSVSSTADDDDGTPIASEVILGPLLTKDLDDVLLKDLQAVLGADSGNVTFGVYVGETAEVALLSVPVYTGTWKAGRNFSNFIRRAGHAVWVKISASNSWSFEIIRARIQGQGKVRRRGNS